MAELLFLAHRIPYPPDKGDKIRSWHFLRHLAGRHRISLAAFVDDPDDLAHVPTLEAICAETRFVTLNRSATLRSAAALLTREPITLRHYRHAGMAAWIRDVIARRRPQHVFVYSSAMAQYVMERTQPPLRRIIDFVDVDSVKWRQYAARKAWPARIVYAREASTLLSFERRVAACFDASVFVSAAEAALFRSVAPESEARVRHISNGVDTDFFSPERGYPLPFEKGPALVFTGAMDYWPNIDAVIWFAREVLPRVQRRMPALRFYIVGSNPAATVRDLARLPGVVVTGRVADVRPYLAHAAAVVAPLRVARGIQNKVLEGMAMARPMIATPAALEGIDAVADAEVVLAAEAEDLAGAVLRVLATDSLSLGQAARRRVLADHGWAASLARLDALIEAPAGERKREA